MPRALSRSPQGAKVCIYIVPKDPDASQTEPNKDLTDSEQKDPETPTTPTQPSKPDYSMYSDIFRTVLESDYYNDLIFRYENDHEAFLESIPGKAHDLGINLMEPIPYLFLKEAGEDVKAIKIMISPLQLNVLIIKIIQMNYM